MLKNTILKYTPIVVAFIAGGGVGFLLTKNQLEKKYAALAEEEIESVKAMFEEFKLNLDAVLSEKKRPPRIENTLTDAEREALQKSLRENVSKVVNIRTNPYEDAKRQYMTTPKDESEDDEPETDDAGMTEEDMKEEGPDPYMIDSSEFLNTYDHHEKISLVYYRPDNLLTDEQGLMFDDVEPTLGSGFIDYLNNVGIKAPKQRNDTRATTTLWVRNPRLGIDFEVIALNKSYKAAHADLEEMSPRERHKNASSDLKAVPKKKRRKDPDDD